MKFIPAPKHAFDLKQQKALTKAVNALKNATITDANGNVIGQVLFADGNTVFQINASSVSGDEVKMFKITEIPIPEEGDDFSDYVIAREWDGNTLGSVDVRIAKHPYWRPSITELSVGLITYFFQYDDDNSRTVVTGAAGDDPDFDIDPTYQQLLMPYEVDDYSPANGGHLGILFAAKPSNGTGVDGADWIDLTQRVWARYTPGA